MGESFIDLGCPELDQISVSFLDGTIKTHRSEIVEDIAWLMNKHPMVSPKILRIEWDEEGGCPPSSWGYIQYTVRPYALGAGADGTTDDNVHLLAKIFCERLGIDYAKLYSQAYPDEVMEPGWVESLERCREETIIPDKLDPILILEDLGGINNHSLVDVLIDELDSRGVMTSKAIMAALWEGQTPPWDEGALG